MTRRGFLMQISTLSSSPCPRNVVWNRFAEKLRANTKTIDAIEAWIVRHKDEPKLFTFDRHIIDLVDACNSEFHDLSKLLGKLKETIVHGG